MRLNLNSLIDEDNITSAQERVIRRTVPHKLYKYFKTDTKEHSFSLVYRIKGDDPTKHYEFDFVTLEMMRSKAYKMVMWDLIKVNSYKMTDTGAIQEIIHLIERNVTKETSHQVMLCFGNGTNFVSPTHIDIQSNVLFRILQVMGVLK